MTNRIAKSALGLTLAALLGSALAGCSSDNGGTPSPSASPSQVATETASQSGPVVAATPTPAVESPGLPQDTSAEILAAFEAKIKAGATAAELNAALDADLAKTTPETADEMIRDLLAYYDAHLQDTVPELQADDVQQILKLWPFTEDKISQIKSDLARQAVQNVYDGGYKLETAEGMIFPVVDYGKLKRFDDAISPEMRDYVALLATESDQKSASDGGLVISWDEVANRALAAEKYIRDYPDSKEKAAAGDLYLRYMTDLLVGLDNTPNFDFETFKLNADVKAEYKKIVSEHADTTTAKMVQQFLDVMAKTNDAVFKKSSGGQTDIPEVKAFRDGMESQIREALGIANSNK